MCVPSQDSFLRNQPMLVNEYTGATQKCMRSTPTFALRFAMAKDSHSGDGRFRAVFSDRLRINPQWKSRTAPLIKWPKLGLIGVTT